MQFRNLILDNESFILFFLHHFSPFGMSYDEFWNFKF